MTTPTPDGLLRRRSMNYEANTIHWQPGDLVLHDCDAKNPDMLLRVVRYLPDGKVRAEYVNAEKRKAQLFRLRHGNASWFDLAELHDPKRFGVAAAAEGGVG
jgi:hypothetical protein